MRRNCISSQWTMMLITMSVILLLYSVLWYKSPSSEMKSPVGNTVIYINNNRDKSQTMKQTSLSLKSHISKREKIIEKLIWALQPKNRQITLVINSCGRLDLLNETIHSYLKYYPHKKYPLFEKIIIDDCREADTAHELIDAYYPQFQIMLTANNEFEQGFTHRDERITNAMDKLFKQVVTPWIYHLEDDWIFTRDGFIDESFDIFEASIPEEYQSGDEWKDIYDGYMEGNTFPERYRDPEHNGSRMDHYFFNPNNLYSVVLCWNMYRQKPWCNRTYLYEYKGSKWYNMKYNLKRGVTWGGYSFNAGLQPTFLYKMYGDFLSPDGEWGRSEKMIGEGFKVALMSPPACDHIGGNRHVGPIGLLKT